MERHDDSTKTETRLVGEKVVRTKKEIAELKAQLQRLIDRGLRDPQPVETVVRPPTASVPKTRGYDPQAARDYIKKQREKRSKLLKDGNRSKETVDLRKRRLHDLRLKSLELVKKSQPAALHRNVTVRRTQPVVESLGLPIVEFRVPVVESRLSVVESRLPPPPVVESRRLPVAAAKNESIQTCAKRTESKHVQTLDGPVWVKRGSSYPFNFVGAVRRKLNLAELQAPDVRLVTPSRLVKCDSDDRLAPFTTVGLRLESSRLGIGLQPVATALAQDKRVSTPTSSQPVVDLQPNLDTVVSPPKIDLINRPARLGVVPVPSRHRLGIVSEPNPDTILDPSPRNRLVESVSRVADLNESGVETLTDSDTSKNIPDISSENCKRAHSNDSSSVKRVKSDSMGSESNNRVDSSDSELKRDVGSESNGSKYLLKGRSNDSNSEHNGSKHTESESCHDSKQHHLSNNSSESNSKSDLNDSKDSDLRAPDLNLVDLNDSGKLEAPSFRLTIDAYESERSARSVDGEEVMFERKVHTSEIHLRFEAELHLLNEFNESLQQVMAIEKSLVELHATSNTSAEVSTIPPPSSVNVTRGCDDASDESIVTFERLIADEDSRIDNLKSILKMREKSLVERTRGELAWLEAQKRHLRDSGQLREISAIKKKQRGLLIKLEHERHEMQRLKHMQKAASRERINVLKERRDALIKGQLSSTNVQPRVRQRRKSSTERKRTFGPLKVYDLSCGSKPETSGVSVKTEREEVRAGSLVETRRPLVESDCIKRSLQLREAALAERRRTAEELLQWHQRLVEEEAKIARLETAAIAILKLTPNSERRLDDSTSESGKKPTRSSAETPSNQPVVRDSTSSLTSQQAVECRTEPSRDSPDLRYNRSVSETRNGDLQRENSSVEVASDDLLPVRDSTCCRNSTDTAVSDADSTGPKNSSSVNSVSNDLNRDKSSVETALVTESQDVTGILTEITAERDSDCGVSSESEISVDMREPASKTNEDNRVLTVTTADCSRGLESETQSGETEQENLETIDLQVLLPQANDSLHEQNNRVETQETVTQSDHDSRVRSETVDTETTLDLTSETNRVPIDKTRESDATNGLRVSQDSNNDNRLRVLTTETPRSPDHVDDSASVTESLNETIDSRVSNLRTEEARDITEDVEFSETQESLKTVALEGLEPGTSEGIERQRQAIDDSAPTSAESIDDSAPTSAESELDRKTADESSFFEYGVLEKPNESVTVECDESPGTSEGRESPTMDDEVRLLLRKQLEIEDEIKKIQQQQQNRHRPSFTYVREIPNKPPPPYTPPQPAGSVLPASEKHLTSITSTVASILTAAHANDRLTEASLTAEHKHQTCFEFVFDLCKETALNSFRPEQTRQSLNKNRPVLDVIRLAKRTRQLLGYDVVKSAECARRRKWSGKKRDHVDELLAIECQDEEAEWVDYGREEALVNDDLCRDLMDVLLGETADAFKRVLDKRTFAC